VHLRRKSSGHYIADAAFDLRTRMSNYQGEFVLVDAPQIVWGKQA